MLASSLLALDLLAACSVNPVTGRRELVLTSVARERELGMEETRRLREQIGLLSAGEPIARYLEAVGGRIAEAAPRREIEYRFYVVETLEPNAFAVPGGHVFVSRGLLALTNSEDELASVLAHEVGHVAARHAVNRYSLGTPLELVTGLGTLTASIVGPLLGHAVPGVGRLATALLLAPYSREQEREADRAGQEIVAAAGWDPGALAAILRTLDREESLRGAGRPKGMGFLSSHPSAPERIRDATERAKELRVRRRAPIARGRAGYLRRLDGLRAGEDPREGLFVNGVFLHPDLGFRLRFPQGWEARNARSHLAGAAPDGRTFAVLDVVAEATDPGEAARRFEKDAKVELEGLAPTTVGELSAVHATARYHGRALDLTWIAHDGHVYRITGICPPVLFDAGQASFLGIVQSFRPIRESERAAIPDTRLRIVTSRDREALGDLVARTASEWSLALVAVANGLEPGGRLAGGTLLKIAVRERYAP